MNLIQPEKKQVLERSVKVILIIGLTIGLIYWGSAYFLDIALFEF